MQEKWEAQGSYLCGCEKLKKKKEKGMISKI